MVKIKCTKDDPRVHMLAQLFKANDIPLEKICVRRSGSFSEYLGPQVHIPNSYVSSVLRSIVYEI
jgi:hypothetical protein